MKFKTENSTYEVGNFHWKRTETNGVVDPETPLRTEEGDYISHTKLEVGKEFIIFAKPLDSRGVVRMITTTPVQEIL